MRKQTLSLAAVAAGAALALSACGGVSTSTGGDDGGEYPSGSVEMYVGADPGGSSDLISRQVATGLTDELGETFSVINRSGSNGALAAAEVEQAEPDGNIIAIQNASLFAITPLAVAEDEVTNIDDFDVVGGVSRDDYVLVTSADNDWTTIDDLKGAGKKVTYGTTGVGTGSQLSCALTYSTAGIDSEAVPFDGGAPALTALLGNQVDTACLQVGEARENIESGKIDRPLGLRSRAHRRPPRRADRHGAGHRRRGLPVPLHDHAEGHPAGRQGHHLGGHAGDVRDRGVPGLQRANSLTPMEIPGDEVVEALETDKQRYADLVEQYDINLAE